MGGGIYRAKGRDQIHRTIFPEDVFSGPLAGFSRILGWLSFGQEPGQ
jgi:hypothetical protein